MDHKDFISHGEFYISNFWYMYQLCISDHSEYIHHHFFCTTILPKCWQNMKSGNTEDIHEDIANSGLIMHKIKTRAINY